MLRRRSSKPLLAALLWGFACQRVTSPYDDIADGAGGTGNTAASGGRAPNGGTADSAGNAGDGGDDATAGVGGTSDGGAPSPPVSGASGDGGADPRGCADLTADLCMTVTWPNGVVPYAGEPAWGELVWSNVLHAIDAWDGVVVGSGELTFVNEPRPGVPTLRLTLDSGCAPASVTEDAVTVAIGACPDVRDIVIAIGMALGVPPMHQRADRDRYLLVADESRFDCRRGHFISKCPDRDGVPAQLGPFSFSHALFAYAAPSVESCDAEPSAVPYLARGLPEVACSWVTGNAASGGALGDDLAELYAIADGWLPFVPVGRDVGLDAPLDIELAPDLQTGRHAALVATNAGGLAAFALAGRPSARSLWVVENVDGEAWGAWREVARDLPEPAPFFGLEVVLGLEVVKRDVPSSLYDVVFASRENSFHATVDLSSDRPITWTALGTPGASTISGVAATRTRAGKLVVYASGASLASIELDGDTWTAWQTFPLPAQNPANLEAVTTPDGTEHLAGTTEAGILYTTRAPGGEWHDWTDIVSNAGVSFDVHDLELIPAESELRGLLWHSTERLWHSRCVASPCTEAASWSAPAAIAGVGATLGAAVTAPDRIDVVGFFTDARPSVGASAVGLRHKRWSPPR